MRRVVVLLICAACDSSSSPDAGDATSDVPPFNPEAAPLACPPADAGYDAQPMTPPSAPHAGACTADLANDYAECHGASNPTACQSLMTDAGAACLACIETPSTASSWGPVVTIGTASALNVEGCIDDALGEDAGTGTCGDLLYALYACEAAACTACVGSAHDACTVAAVASVCASFDTPAESTSGPCAPLLGDAAPPAVQSCFPNPSISDPTQREVDWLDRLVTYMCGS